MDNEKVLEEFDTEIYARTSNNNMPAPTGKFIKLTEEEMKQIEESFKLSL